MDKNEYKNACVKDLGKALRSGEETPKSLVEHALTVIKEEDGEMGAFVEVFDDLESQIERANALLKEGGTPLTGIPIAIKDNICFKGKRVTAASEILGEFVSPYSATVVEKLEKAGAIIVGRTNMDEFGMGSSTEKSRYGPTSNPKDTKKVAGGSSGGSAAAVSMGAVPLALGSDTGGSVRQPANFCGVVGIKPTYGKVSRHGLISLGSSLDVIGCIGKSVEDVKKALECIEGEEGFDSTIDKYSSETVSKKGVIGVIPKYTDEAFVKKLQEKGYAVKNISIPLFDLAQKLYYIIQPAEASSNLARFDGVRYGKRNSAPSLWEEYDSTRGLGFGAEAKRRIAVGTYVLSAGYSDQYYRKAEKLRKVLSAEFCNVFESVDIFITPTTIGPPFNKGEIQDISEMYAQDAFTVHANLTGMPAVSIPYGDQGTQIIGNYGSEDTLFSYAQEFERA